MSSLPTLFKAGRLITEGSSIISKNTSLQHFSKPSYSSYRSIWNSMISRKEAAASESSSAEPSVEDAKAQVDELLKALKEMKESRDALEDKYKRALAEVENIRRRLTKQIQEAKVFGIQGFCKDMLEVADVLGKATECVPKEEVSDKNPHLKNLYEGITMTESVLKNVFSRHGVELINPVDEKFNPNFHEALFEQQVEGKEAGTVVVVSKPGYKLHDRVIRPALVGVSK